MSEFYINSGLVTVLVILSILTLGALLLFLFIRICIDMKRCCGNDACGIEKPTRIILQDARTVQNQDVERNQINMVHTASFK